MAGYTHRCLSLIIYFYSLYTVIKVITEQEDIIAIKTKAVRFVQRGFPRRTTFTVVTEVAIADNRFQSAVISKTTYAIIFCIGEIYPIPAIDGQYEDVRS